MSKKIPITILTGFLWSGKTTLLNHIIRQAHGRKIAVVENEFGSLGIDADLIEKSAEEIIEISNGCICCTVRKDFMEAIERLFSSGKEFDHIIIESSGMSEPLPIAQSFLMNDMNWRVRLDSIICLVDALNITKNIVQNTQTALEQIEFADYIIVSKWELVDGVVHGAIDDIIRRVNAYAPIIREPIANISIETLLDTERVSLESAEKLKNTEDVHMHEETIGHYLYQTDESFDHIALSEFFRDLPYEVYRVKWFVKLAHAPEKRFLVQKVGARFTVEDIPHENSSRESTLVFIGKNINPLFINSELSKCQRKTSLFS